MGFPGDCDVRAHAGENKREILSGPAGKSPVLLIVLTILVLSQITGCAALIRQATAPALEGMVTATMKQDDLELVRLGAPGYLLMADGLVEQHPDSVYLLTAAARLYSAYSSAFVLGREPERARSLTRKARDYAFRAMSLQSKAFAALHDKPLAEFEPVAADLKKADVELLFVLVSAWAGYIEAHGEDWDVVADLPKIDLLTRRLLELDETHYYGSGHLILAVMNTLLPPALGGKPEQGRVHFERAIEISRGALLQAHVLYASRYARMTGDRELYQQLLTHVRETPADTIPTLTLMNTVAKVSAAELLADIDKYF